MSLTVLLSVARLARYQGSIAISSWLTVTRDCTADTPGHLLSLPMADFSSPASLSQSIPLLIPMTKTTTTTSNDYHC